MSGQNAVVEPKALPALHRNQRRFLYLGGAVVTLLMVATIFAIALSSIRDYHRQQREIFQEAGTDIDALLARLKLQHRNAMRVFSSLWLTQQPWLQSVGAPLQKQFAAQDGQLLIQVDPPNQPWLILGVDTTGLPDATQAAILGLAREASTLAPAARGGKPGTRAYVYDPLGRMFGIEGVDTEAQLLGALHVQTRKQALERLMLADDRWQREAVHAMGAPAVDNRVAPLFLGHDPLTGEPAIVEGLRLPFAPDSGSRAIVFESLGQLVESLSPPASVRLVSATDETILGENQAPDVHKADPALLQELHDHLPRHHGPVLFSKGGMYKVAGTLRNADWTLVRLYSRQQMLVDIGHRLLPFLLVTALILAILWTLLLYTDRRVFAPALAGVERVYESEALSRIIIEASPVGLCLLDPESHQPIMENDVMRGFAADSAEPPSSLYARLAAGAPGEAGRSDRRHPAGQLEFQLDVERRDGENRNLLVATVPYVYRERRALLCVVRDGTAQTEAEEYLRQTRHEAEQARLSAEAANRAKSSFVSMMSHEIRTPLNGVLGHLELLSHSTLDTAQREHLGRIRQSAELLLTIVSDVLDFSKIEAGQLAIDPVPFALRPLIEQTALLYAPLALRKGLRLYFGIDPALEPSYVADANRIRQILNNLVSNAVKFTESGRILLRASRLAGGEGEPDMLRFEVIDSGIGMSDEEVSRLFEPFTQIDASISRRFGGTGLGLALCHQLGKLLGGRISVQSTPAVGSIFALDIPAARSTEAQPDTRHLLRGYRIALLSGMAKWRQEVSALLGGWGADVLTVGLPSELDKHWVRDAHALVIFGEQQSWSDEDEYALLACARRVIRAYMDGPLLPHRVDGAWLISCYSSEALRAAIVREDADEPMAGDAPSLPAAAAPATGDESAPSPVADDGQPARGRVLLVDDNPVNRELIQQQLEALGYATATAEDGEAALELWTNGDFDIVLTDISMPRMNGYQLARALRDRGVTLPILAVTAAALTSERSRCREAGITDLLLKPISLGQLEAAMNRHVPRQPEPAADATSPPQAWPVSPKVREIFVRSGTHDLETILDAVNRDDETMLMDRLHSLKGALLVLGEVSLAEACATLQAEVDDAGLHATRDAVAVLEQRLRDTIARYASEP